MWVPSLGREDPLGEGMATDSSVLAWRIPQWATVPRVTKSQTSLSTRIKLDSTKKEARIYNGAKTASSINDVGKTGQPHAK